MTYDLTTEPWIPCRNGPGGEVRLGLRDTLLRAHELVDLAGDTPLVTGALLRLLIALVHDVIEGPTFERRLELWEQGRWEEDLVTGYFAQHGERFDLFHPDLPFLQDPGFELPQADSIARLAPELASGNNVALFDHTVDEQPPAVPPDTAARWLVAHQLYGLGGGQGPTSPKHGKHPYASHAPAALGANVFLCGETLFQTLLLNLMPVDDPVLGTSMELGLPLWRREAFPGPQVRHPDGYLDYLTWPNRCVRLMPAIDGERPVVRQVYTAQGSALPKDHPYRDPWFALRTASDGRSLPLRVTAGRALWRDSAALFGFAAPEETKAVGDVPRPAVFRAADVFLAEDPPGVPAAFDCLVVGMDFDQSKIRLWRLEELPVPADLLRDVDTEAALRQAVGEADTVGDHLRNALRFMAAWRLSPDDGKADRGMVTSTVESWQAEPAYWSALDTPFRDLVHGLTGDRDAAVVAWREEVVRAADRAFDQAARQNTSDDRGLRAQVKARGLLMSRTWELRPKREEATVES